MICLGKKGGRSLKGEGPRAFSSIGFYRLQFAKLLQGGATQLCCGAVCGAGVREETMALAPLSASFQSLPSLPTIKLGYSGAASRVGGFVYILGPCGSLQLTLL